MEIVMSVSTIIFIALIVWMVWMHTSGHTGCGEHTHSGEGGADGR